MRIAQVAPLTESVPPTAYGGTERIVSYLTEELIHQGHEVTLFASGDSVTRAQLKTVVPKALRLGDSNSNHALYHALLAEKVLKNASDFDIIHYHSEALYFPTASKCETPNVTTLHGRLDLPELSALFKEFNQLPVVSISNDQISVQPDVNWYGTVYNGIAPDNYTFNPTYGQYLVFLGRICPEKRVDRAIEIANRVATPLLIAAKVDAVDKQYYEEQIKPLFKYPNIEYLGEITESEKDKLLGNAIALLLPIDWPEPFGLVMIEALACGTPVIAYRQGAVPEVIEQGRTGYIVDSIDSAVTAVENIKSIDRYYCRQVFESRFSAARMTRNYISVYKKLVQPQGLLRLVS